MCDDHNHRIQVFGLDGSFGRQWGTRGAGEGQFSRPTAVAVSGGEVYVCDDGNHHIQVFGLDGSFVRQWGMEGVGEGQFCGPRGVAVSGGEVYVCDRCNQRIQVFGLDGSFARQWGICMEGEESVQPWDVTVSDGEVLVSLELAGSHGQCIQVFR